jgi:hypothetical protein
MKVMISRFSLFFSLILIIFISFYAFFSHLPVCTDPAGCISINVEDPVVLGIGVFTTGLDQPVSLEIQNTLELFTKNFEPHPPRHPISIQTYYSSCLPNVPVQSTVDLSADNHLLAVIGPICGEDTADFSRRMVSANKVTISPLPFRSFPGETGISFNPDIDQLAGQAAVWVQRLGFSRIFIIHDVDDQSSTFSSKMCKILRTNGTCDENIVGSSDLQLASYEALVEVFLDESNPPLPDTSLSGSALPKIQVSFSRPAISSEKTLSFYWIGPQAWNENENFSSSYFAAFNSYPSSFAAWVLYSRLPMIYNTVEETSVTAWDGSWIIPMGRFKQRLLSEFAKDDVFCLASTSDCHQVPFVMYQVSGNDYKLFNP